MERFFGGRPLSVILWLVAISIITGIVLAAFDLRPEQLFELVPNIVNWFAQLGWGWVQPLIRWFLLGAVIVVPIWVIIRVLKLVSGDNGRASRS
jgi:hypothetical protein